MTSIILTTICAFALNAASIPAQADTNAHGGKTSSSVSSFFP